MVRETRLRVKVLVVDDHILVAEGIASLLSSEIHAEVVGIAKNGNECLSAVIEKRPEVILLDINLPDISGLDLIPKIKRINDFTAESSKI